MFTQSVLTHIWPSWAYNATVDSQKEIRCKICYISLDQVVDDNTPCKINIDNISPITGFIL
jgi:hypothetical protein